MQNHSARILFPYDIAWEDIDPGKLRTKKCRIRCGKTYSPKKMFITLQEAKEAAKHHGQESYPCPHCLYWHNASANKRRKKNKPL